ncbi:MAG: hypothetical protein K2J77_10360 [Oscillospiraceae bacterium]|nr:hypothetical protein [Oscillospiraceae bacterium]
MRITNSILLRGYNRDLNRLMTQKTACERRITSTRKFSRASEAPLSAAKALNVRKSLYYTEQYTENLKTANKFYTEAETSLLQVSDKLATIRETLIAACNTTKDAEEYSIYGEQLEMIAKELVSIFNTDSAGRAIFGGESDDSMPFGLIEDSTGHVQTVTYHGVPVNAMNDPNAFPYSKPVTIDVGLGMDMDQKTQEVNPQSVLDISFNGAKITGCGADRGTADIDLNSIKVDRKYCFDVYAGSIKKTIEFTGKATQEDNVAEINRALEVAFSKEVAYDKVKQPTMDINGVIYSEGSIVNAVNNTTKGAEKLSIDNDAGYTDKCKLNFAALKDNTEYSIDVTVGSITKSITFVADDDPDPKKREENTIDLIQAELDKVFGTDDDGNHICYISKNPVTKGCFSAEGQVVSVEDSMKMTVDTEIQRGATVTSEPYDQIDLVKLNAGNKYVIKVNGAEKTFTAGNTTADTIKAIEEATGLKASGPFGDKKSIYFEDGDSFAKLGEVDKADFGVIAIKPSSGAKYTVDLNALNDGQEYCLKVVYNNKAKIISFIGSTDPETARSNIQGALSDMFGLTGAHAKISIDEDGVVTAYDGNPVSVTTVLTGSASDPKVASRDVIYSNNYLQLTIDAARALRAGDIDYANGCIDKIVMANEHLLVQIADLGCNEDFIDFNIEKLTTRELNLCERQNDLEITDAEKEITLWKTYEALYNACLQMSSSVVPNSIFNYIR